MHKWRRIPARITIIIYNFAAFSMWHTWGYCVSNRAPHELRCLRARLLHPPPFSHFLILFFNGRIEVSRAHGRFLWRMCDWSRAGDRLVSNERSPWHVSPSTFHNVKCGVHYAAERKAEKCALLERYDGRQKRQANKSQTTIADIEICSCVH